MTRQSFLPAASAGVAFAAALAAVTTFGNETHAVREYLVALAIAVLAVVADVVVIVGDRTSWL